MAHQPDTSPLVKIRCTRCGIVVVDISAVTVTHDSGTQQGGTCWIRCTCGTEMLQGVGRRSIDLLRVAGVGGDRRSSWMGPITRREIMSFRRRLARIDDVARVASGVSDGWRLHRDPTR